MDWFKREWLALQRATAVPTERLMPYSCRESAKAAKRRLEGGR